MVSKDPEKFKQMFKFFKVEVSPSGNERDFVNTLQASDHNIKEKYSAQHMVQASLE